MRRMELNGLRRPKRDGSPASGCSTPPSMFISVRLAGAVFAEQRAEFSPPSTEKSTPFSTPVRTERLARCHVMLNAIHEFTPVDQVS